jgi:hypothetical protein
LGVASLIFNLNRTVESELIAAGRSLEADDHCESIADYYSREELNCDEAGEFAEGMRASRSAEVWSARARQLRQKREGHE